MMSNATTLGGDAKGWCSSHDRVGTDAALLHTAVETYNCEFWRRLEKVAHYSLKNVGNI